MTLVQIWYNDSEYQHIRTALLLWLVFLSETMQMAFIKQGRLSQDQSLNRPENFITKIFPELLGFINYCGYFYFHGWYCIDGKPLMSCEPEIQWVVYLFVLWSYHQRFWSCIPIRVHVMWSDNGVEIRIRLPIDWQLYSSRSVLYLLRNVPIHTGRLSIP